MLAKDVSRDHPCQQVCPVLEQNEGIGIEDHFLVSVGKAEFSLIDRIINIVIELLVSSNWQAAGL